MCVDTGRVFSTGMSNGAQMSSLLACMMSDRFTAVAPDSGVEFYDSCRGRPVPVIAFHGTADPIVPYAGGGLDATRIADLEYWHGHVPPGLPQHHGVDAAMRAWAAHNGCDPNRSTCASRRRCVAAPGSTAARRPSSTSSTAVVTRGRASRFPHSSRPSVTRPPTSTRRH